MSDPITLKEFYQRAEESRRARHPYQRTGQALFNILDELRPDLAKKIVGTIIDPFYNDNHIERFKAFLEENWDN